MSAYGDISLVNIQLHSYVKNYSFY